MTEKLGFEQLESASRVREVIKKLASKQIETQVPQPTIGRVMTVDLPRLRATVWFPNEDQPVEVRLLSSIIPGDWQQRSNRGAFTSTSGYGSIVAVQRINNTLYITEILTGGQFSFDQQTMGHSIVAQRATPISAGDTTSIVPIVGDPVETFINCTVEDFTIGDGGTIQFGPFTGTNTLPMAGWVEVTVTVSGSAVKYYKFPVNPLYDFQYTGGNGALDSWFRLVPEQQICDVNGQIIEFDFEITLKKTPYGNAVDFFENQELWMRVVKRGSGWTGLSATVTVRATNIQKGRSLQGRELFMQEALASPAEAKGYLGFHNSQMIFRDFDDYGNADNFGRTLSNDWGTSDSNISWLIKSGGTANFGVNGTAAFIAPPGNTVSYIAANKTNMSNYDVYWDTWIDVMPTGAEVQTGVIARYQDNNNLVLLKVMFMTTGQLTLSAATGVAGSFSSLGTDLATGISFSVGERIRCRARIYGSAVFVKCWKPASQREPDWMYVGGPAGLTPNAANVAGFFVQPGGSNTNTKPFNVWFDNVRATYYPKGQDNSGKQWHTGPWRTGLLRMAENLQKTWIQQGQFYWDRTNGLKWTGRILLGGVGQHRMGLGAGTAMLQMPPPTSLSGFSIPIVPSGTSATVGANGIPLQPGEALWCAIPPGQTWENLYEYLFIVSATSQLDFDLPEWAVLIAYRNPDTNSGPDLRLGNGMHLDAWRPLTYTSSWADQGGNPHGQYRLLDPNNLQIVGRMTPGTKANGTPAFTLPVFFAPSAQLTIPAMVDTQTLSQSPHFELDQNIAYCWGVTGATVVSVMHTIPLDLLT